MALIPREVLLVYQEVMVCIQLPKTTIQYVEVLVRKVLTNHVDVVLVAYLKKCVHQIRQLEIAPRYFVVII